MSAANYHNHDHRNQQLKLHQVKLEVGIGVEITVKAIVISPTSIYSYLRKSRKRFKIFLTSTEAKIETYGSPNVTITETKTEIKT
ncbi:hypothetical protein K502DRAFT_353120 [Neoconidiobolus thromboides FSU 785]|nr:hypothetical protein K502DRAFT_353120 [Neoconidiobolus thromboides FSU 785]